MNSKNLEVIMFHIYLELILNPELIMKISETPDQNKKENGQNQLWALKIDSVKFFQTH